MEDLLQALVTAIISLTTVIGTLVATFRFYLPRRDRNRALTNPDQTSTLEELLRLLREANQADAEHHAREEQWQEEVTRTFQRIEARLRGS